MLGEMLEWGEVGGWVAYTGVNVQCICIQL